MKQALIALLVALVGLVVVLAVAVFVASEWKVRNAPEVEAREVAIPREDAEAIEHGEHLAVTRGCAECHGAELSGGVVIDDPMMGFVQAPNLTRGENGLPEDYADLDWVRAIRHGLDREGGPLLVMPSEEYWWLDDADLGALVAYLDQLPATDGLPSEIRFGPMGRLLLATNQIRTAASIIDHDELPPQAPEPVVSVEYGQYIARTCTGCHGEDLAGGPIPGGPPDWPAAANLTPHEDGLGDWTEEDFVVAIQEGVRPDGTALDPVMPYSQFARMSLGELAALWLYLESLEPVASESG